MSAIGILLVALILVVALGASGVIFGRKASKTLDQLAHLVNSNDPKQEELKGAADYPENSLERTVLEVPSYNPEELTREEEYTAKRETPVIEKLHETCPTEVVSPKNSADAKKPPSFQRSNSVDVGTSTSFESEDEETADKDTEDVCKSAAPGIEKFIEHIIYINLKTDKLKRKSVEEEIDNLCLPDFVKRERLSAVMRLNKHLGKILSHIACLAKALSLKKNVLVLEDNFHFDRTPAEILQALTSVQSQVGNRWDVISFSQCVEDWQLLGQGNGFKVCRIFRNSSTAGYLVNKNYISRLMSYLIQRMRSILPKPDEHTDQIIQNIWTSLQNTDLWVGFNLPLGHQGRHVWRYLDTLSHKTNSSGEAFKVELRRPFEKKRVALCHMATGKDNIYAPAIQKDCYLKLLKGHHLEFFMFSDEPQAYLPVTEEGGICHVFLVDQDDSPEPQDGSQETKGSMPFRLKRFHYLLQAEEALRTFDFIYYMDVDYRIYQHPVEEKIMQKGIVATSHLRNVVERQDESSACIRPDEKMTTYFSSSFHGGSAPEYLEMCRVLSRNIEADWNKGIQAKFQDESHLNRYLLSHPPAVTLSQSYIFSERCLDIKCQEPMCQALRNLGHLPIMGHVRP